MEADTDRPYKKLSDQRLGESSETVRQREEAARERQRKRFEGVDGLRQDIACNADMGGKEHRYRRMCASTVRWTMRAVR